MCLRAGSFICIDLPSCVPGSSLPAGTRIANVAERLTRTYTIRVDYC